MNRVDLKKAILIIIAIAVSIGAMWYYAMIKFDDFIENKLHQELENYSNNITYDRDDVELDRVNCKAILKNVVIFPDDRSYRAEIDQLQVGFNIFQAKIILNTVGEKIELFEEDKIIAKIPSPKLTIDLSEKISDDKEMRFLIDINALDNIITNEDGSKEIMHIFPGSYNIATKPMPMEESDLEPLHKITFHSYSRGFKMGKEFLARDLKKMLLGIYGINTNDYTSEKLDDFINKYSELTEINSEKYLTTNFSLIVDKKSFDFYKDNLFQNFKDFNNIILSKEYPKMRLAYSFDTKNILRIDVRMDSFKDAQVNFCAIRLMNKANKPFFSKLSECNISLHDLLLSSKANNSEDSMISEEDEKLIISSGENIADFINFIKSKNELMFNVSSTINIKDKKIDFSLKVGSDTSNLNLNSKTNDQSELESELVISRPREFLNLIKISPRKIFKFSEILSKIKFQDTITPNKLYNTLSNYEEVIENLGFEFLSALNEGGKLLERKQFKTMIVLNPVTPFSDLGIKINGKLFKDLENNQVIKNFFAALLKVRDS